MIPGTNPVSGIIVSGFQPTGLKKFSHKSIKRLGAVPGMEQGGRIKGVGKVAWKSTLSSVQSM